MNPQIDLTPLSDPAHPKFHISLGQVFGLALLGLSAYSEQNAPGSGPAIFLNPTTIGQYLQGIMSLFPPKPAA